MLKGKKSLCMMIILVTACAAFAFKGIVLGGTKKSASTMTTNINKTSVKVVKASTDTMVNSTSFNASLEASEEGTISSKIGGKVIEVSFENGRTVSAGQALAKLDDTDIRNNIKSSEAQLTAAEAQLRSAESSASSSQIMIAKQQTNLETAQRNYYRTKALFDQGAVSKVEFEASESSLKLAQADLESAKASSQSSSLSTETQRANIQKSQTDLNTLRESLQNTTITAPTSGIISGKSITVGQYLSPGTVLGKVQNISFINAVIEVKESDLSYVKLGAMAKFKLSDKDSEEYDGVVKSIDGAADPISRVFKCRIQIDNKDGKLKPGVFGNIKIATDENKKAIMVPLKALAGSEGKYYVFVNNNGVAKKQNITVGEISEDTVEIKSGVQDGDSIIYTNVGTLQDGDAVKVAAE
ncbi:efflux RND transporter periplasmic adaptor subunit [Clostridium sp. A1-XYC3]|uniref:Efflux RND transporter periplasmic adaptor subunit n=1 Tax=Clostridium tanneri TaxID=3037988 RepID=A0ABU4JXZ3_9CLOT|nr:efflux RND transporter periplasmic adaptor subunit [Clostridium sp. A1-XYC3]MDW8803027.1 efflux RND transporter periplasmic adaptor subunit [Clostridium sp. A1-XYC3]